MINNTNNNNNNNNSKAITIEQLKAVGIASNEAPTIFQLLSDNDIDQTVIDYLNVDTLNNIGIKKIGILISTDIYLLSPVISYIICNIFIFTKTLLISSLSYRCRNSIEVTQIERDKEWKWKWKWKWSTSDRFTHPTNSYSCSHSLVQWTYGTVRSNQWIYRRAAIVGQRKLRRR